MTGIGLAAPPLSFATKDDLNNVNTILNNLQQTHSTDTTNLTNSVNGLNNFCNNLSFNNISGICPIEKGGTSANNWYDAGYNLNSVVYTGNLSTSAGNRSDGYFSCCRYNNIVRFVCRIISGGKSITCGTYVPDGYRPAIQVRIPCVGLNSGSIVSYGTVFVETSGQIRIILSSSTDAEICCEGWWTINY